MTSDVVIVGAGFAGACAAHALAGLGLELMLVDRRPTFPASFRAEKLEKEQADILRDIGILDLRAPISGPVGPVLELGRPSPAVVDTVEQYGVDYTDTVNRLRANLPDGVTQTLGRVSSVHPDETEPEVRLEDGRRLRARLVVLATGGSEKLRDQLGIEMREDPTLRSLSFGFDVGVGKLPTKGPTWANYYFAPNGDAVDYVTVFPIGDRNRINLFTQLEVREDLVAAIKSEPVAFLEERAPGLIDHFGALGLASIVRVVPTSFARARRPQRHGVVLIGEEFQTVSPTTGMGLSKVLTDVVALRDRLGRALAAGATVGGAVREYYEDSRKLRVDRQALSSWIRYAEAHRVHRFPRLNRLRRRVQVRSWT